VNIEDRLREMLGRRADDATPSPYAWSRIEERLERPRWRNPWVVAGALAPTAALVVAVVMVAGRGGDGSEDVAAGPDPTTATSAVDGGVEVPGDDALGVFPAVLRSDLEALQREVDAGHDAWMLDPEQVAAAYLRERALGGATISIEGGSGGLSAAPAEGELLAVSVVAVYSHGEASGTLLLQRLTADNESIWFVSTVGSDEVEFANLAYDSHGGLDVTLRMVDAGGVEVVADAPYTDWSRTWEGDFAAGSEPSFSADASGDPPPAVVLVRVQYEGPDGSRSIVEDLVLAGSSQGSESVGAEEPADEPCRSDLEVRDASADEALRAWFAEVYETTDTIHDQAGQPQEFVITGFTVTGDVLRTDTAAEVCVRTTWATDPEQGSGDAVGYTDDVVSLERRGDEWAVAGVRRSTLKNLGEWMTAEVAFLDPSGECGESDAEFKLLPAAVVVEGEDPLSAAVHTLLTGWTQVGDEPFRHTLPLHTRLVGLDVDEQGVAHVELSAPADDGGGSCLMNARKEQVRRTVLAADPSVADVVVTVDGRPPEESFQP